MSMDNRTLCLGWYIAEGKPGNMPAKWEDQYQTGCYVILETNGTTQTAKPIYHQNGELIGWIPTNGSITDLIPAKSVYAYTTVHIPDVIRNSIRKET